MIIILIKLIAAHILGDFIFQTDKICEMKYSNELSKRLTGLAIHSGIQAILSYVFIAEWTLWIVPLVIFVCHFIIDLIKVYCNGKRLPAFIVDQLAHYIVIIGLWWLLCFKWCFSISTPWLSLSFWAILTSYIAVLGPTSILIKSFIEFEGWITNQSSSIEERPQQDEQSQQDESLQGLPNAGKWIGFLERVLILTFIYTSNIEGIGFLLAAKSVFRFGELNRTQDIKVTEYVLIGTFVSFTIAIVMGFGVNWLIG